MEQLSSGPTTPPADTALTGPRPTLEPSTDDPRQRLAELLGRLLARRWLRERQRPGLDDPQDPAAGRSPPGTPVR